MPVSLTEKIHLLLIHQAFKTKHFISFNLRLIFKCFLIIIEIVDEILRCGTVYCSQTKNIVRVDEM